MMGFIAYSFERMNISPKEFGVWMATTSVGYVIGNLANKRLLDRYRIELITFTGAIASLASLLLMECGTTRSRTHQQGWRSRCSWSGYQMG